MTQHLHRGIERLKNQLLSLGGMVEQTLSEALVAFQRGDVLTARKIISADERIDLLEVEVEEDCLKLLALHQPVAADLRFIVSILKINNDLERIGDFAVSISWSVVEGADITQAIPSLDLSLITERSKEMLHEALEAVVQVDCDRARTILRMDDVVDAENRRIQREALAEVQRSPHLAEALSRVLSVARSLERVADHATNIAEDVIYMVEGDIVRHGTSIEQSSKERR